MQIATTLFLASMFVITTRADAYVIGGSNLSLEEYPSPTCSKPTKPFDLSDQFSVDEYNSEIETYIQCVREYVDNGNNDIKRIREAQQDAIDEAKSL